MATFAVLNLIPADFKKKTHVWKDKLFLRDELIQFMHIPLNMSAVVKRVWFTPQVTLFKQLLLIKGVMSLE